MSGVRSLQTVAENALIDQLIDDVHGYQAKANFSCGGSVPVDIRSTTRYGNFGSTRTPITSPPVTVRWDAKDGEVSGKLSFPMASAEDPKLQQLLKDCRPATSGHGGENIDDENVQKAAKLEATEFSTTFNPNDCGIVDAVAQALLPGIARPADGVSYGLSTSRDHWGVVAQLSKLNVYSAPSDRVKPYVDNPREVIQFGSLVVCLPNQHSGGHLRVAHKGVERFFGLGSDSTSSSIQWAAFYSDCEHEVLPVTSGHRITLTYQLYVSQLIGGPVSICFPTIDPKLYPLYDRVKEMLSAPAFMKQGGILGWRCKHSYDHTDDTANKRLPYELKGIDVVLFTIFRSLGLRTHVRPVLHKPFCETGDMEMDMLSRDYASLAGSTTRALPDFRRMLAFGEQEEDMTSDSEVSPALIY